MKNGKKISIYDMAEAAVFAAVIAVSAQIQFPLPSGVPVTLQTLAVALCGYCLTIRMGMSAILVYILIGLVGAPVFSGFTGGVAVLFGKTGGFIIGFVFLVFACGAASEAEKKSVRIVFGLIGLILCHLVGTLWYAFLTESSVLSAAVLVSLPFILKDAICVVSAVFLSPRLKSAIAAARSRQKKG